MNPRRGMVCLMLTLATSWSLAGAHPSMPVSPASAIPAGAHRAALPPCCRDCSQKSSDRPARSHVPASPNCMMMQCCRMVPAQAQSQPQLDGIEKLAWSDPLPPARLADLSRPAEIFHPPRLGLFA